MVTAAPATWHWLCWSWLCGGSPSPSFSFISHTSLYNTCSFPYLHNVPGHGVNPWCRNVPLLIPVGADGAMVCPSSVCHMPLSLQLGGWREGTHGTFCHWWDTADTLSPMWTKSAPCLAFASDEVAVGFTLVLCKYLHKRYFLGEKRDCVGGGRISQDEFLLQQHVGSILPKRTIIKQVKRKPKAMEQLISKPEVQSLFKYRFIFLKVKITDCGII